MLEDKPGLQSVPPALRLGLVVVVFLWSCSGGNSGSSSTPAPLPPAALTIVTTSLPNGQVAHAYSATLTATGGTAPLSWTLSAGALPAGLALNAASGAISGTPTATAAATPLTFTVTDSSSTVQTQNVSLKLNIAPASLTILPGRAGITTTQTLTLTATSGDNAGITWSVAPAGGSVSPASSPSGGSVTFTPPVAAGVYTLTATSVTNASETASVTVGVTDLAGVYTYHNDLARDGANTSEYALTPGNVHQATFGKLFSCTVDGAVYAQPLWVANLSVAGARHNVILLATQHDSLYAFDADTNASPCAPLWKVSLIDTAHGARAGIPETSVPSGDVPNPLVGQGPGSDISPEVGVTSTPVIDPASGILYVVSKSVESGSTTIHQRLHAIDLASGGEKSGSPVAIAPTWGSIAYDPGPQNQRAGLALVNGTVYVASGSHDDIPVWYGWIIGYTYSGTTFTQSAVLNVTPNVGEGGIWMSGAAPSADSNGNLYVITGNGTFDATSAIPPNTDYGDAFLQLTPGLGVASWFSPSDEANDYANNIDFGAGGAALVVNLTSGALLRHLVVGGGKDGTLYLLNLDGNVHLAGDSKARQFFTIGTEILATAAFWNDTLYIAPKGSPMLAYAFDPGIQMFLPALAPAPTSQSAAPYGHPGSTPAVSASGASSNGILWAIDSTNFCTFPAPACGPAVLHAYSAANLMTELWNSAMVGADAAGYAVKFTVPTVANGKVYIGTRGNNKGGLSGSTTIPGELDVYGLKPN